MEANPGHWAAWMAQSPLTGGARLGRYLVDFATNRVIFGLYHTNAANVCYSQK